MQPFAFIESTTAEEAAASAAAKDGASFFAGGTTLIDLMKLDVLAPSELIDINHLPFSEIEEDSEGVTVGANVRNSDLAHHPLIRERFPVLSEALLAGASAQLRNMATTGGNMLQRTRCGYFRDIHTRCNKRNPGSGCDALDGVNRSHAILGTSEQCIATNPSDMCVALAILDATVHTVLQDGSKRAIAFGDLHLLPGQTPSVETVLEQGELITHVSIPNGEPGIRSHYLKVRDRASYEFALASAAVALKTEGERITYARVGLGGIATRPWRSKEAEAYLLDKPANRETFQGAAEAALAQAKPRLHNEFKVELSKRTIVAALEHVSER